MPATTAGETQVKSRERGFDAELKRRLIDHLEMLKRPNDLLRVTQVTHRHFRVNTLTPVISDEGLLPVYRIAKSQFLLVEDRMGELVIVDQTA